MHTKVAPGLRLWLRNSCLVAVTLVVQSHLAAGENPTDVANRRFAGMSRAYELDEVQKTWFRTALDRCLIEHAQYESKLKGALQNLKNNTGKGSSPEKFEAARQEYLKTAASDPLSQDNLISLLDQHVRPEQRAIGGDRIRRNRAQIKEGVEKAYQDKVSEQIREAKVIRTQMMAAPQKAPDEPLSMRPPLAGKAQVALSRKESPADQGRAIGGQNIQSNGAQDQGRPIPQPSSMQKGVANARLGEWPRIVSDAAARYHFTAAQRSTAEAILKDCQRRAEAYRAVHAADEQRLASMKDAREKATLQSQLDRPIAAIEQELRERIEAIPTAEQRAAVTTPKRK